MRGLLQGMGDPADRAAEQEEGQSRILGKAEHALDCHIGEIDIGLAVDQPLDRGRMYQGWGQRFGRRDGCFWFPRLQREHQRAARLILNSMILNTNFDFGRFIHSG